MMQMFTLEQNFPSINLFKAKAEAKAEIQGKITKSGKHVKCKCFKSLLNLGARVPLGIINYSIVQPMPLYINQAILSLPLSSK